MQHQGYNLKRNIYYQDNESAIEIEKNGRKLCGEKSRQIHIRYFFINDLLIKANIELIHCPIKRMIADFYTKPLQGALFRKMRDIVMGLNPFPEEERVEINENRANISTENMRQKLVNKATYTDIVHNQRDIKDS